MLCRLIVYPIGVWIWFRGPAESLSGSWTTQVPERPAAQGSRLEDSGVWGWTRVVRPPANRDRGGSVFY